MTASAPAPAKRHRIKWKRANRGDRFQTFWCTIEKAERAYSWGINWHQWEYNTEAWSESDTIELTAVPRDSGTRSSYQRLQIRLWRMRVPRQELRRDLESIGSARTERGRKGWLTCSVAVPDDSFPSLAEAIGRKAFEEVAITVRNLKYGHGEVDNISFRAQLTDLSE